MQESKYHPLTHLAGSAFPDSLGEYESQAWAAFAAQAMIHYVGTGADSASKSAACADRMMGEWRKRFLPPPAARAERIEALANEFVASLPAATRGQKELAVAREWATPKLLVSYAVYDEMKAERDKLRKFKEYVHSYLDRVGVPAAPAGPHGAEGCRIGDRLDWLMARVRSTLAGGPSALEGKYGRISSEKKSFYADEPVFLFRATDIYAVGAVLDYARACRQNDCGEAHVSAIYEHAKRISAWQAAHPGLVKKPD